MIRSYRLDHLRALLLLLVVFGHFLELMPETCGSVYRVIYAFHVPALLFLSSHFAKFSLRRVLRLLCIYGVFQILYRLFAGLLLQEPQSLSLLLLRPYWLLWYLPVLVYCLLLLPLLQRLPARFRPLLFAASVAVSLLWGYLPVSGYALSFGRFFTFLPYFVAGVYLPQLPTPQRKYRLPALAVVCILSAYLLLHPELTGEMLYGAYNYAALGYGVVEKLLFFLTACAWIALLLQLPLPDRPLPLLTDIGQNTLPVYLLHGFVVRLVGQYCRLSLPAWGCFLTALGLSALLLCLLGNRFVGGVFRRCFGMARKKTAGNCEKKH